MPSLFKKVKDFKPFNKKKPQFLQNIKVQALSGEMVLITDIWSNCTVILKVLRRFGCPLCRYESRLLSNLKPEFDKLNVRLIGIGFEEEFIDGKYWEWELFLDTERTVHRALGLVKMPIIAGLADLLTSASKAAVSAALRLGITGDFNGDGFQLGGTYVVGPGNTGLLYEYKQTSAAIYPSIKTIFKAAGGNPDLVEDMAPAECLFYQESVASKSAAPSEATSTRTSTSKPKTINSYKTGRSHYSSDRTSSIVYSTSSITDLSSIKFNPSLDDDDFNDGDGKGSLFNDTDSKFKSSAFLSLDDTEFTSFESNSIYS